MTHLLTLCSPHFLTVSRRYINRVTDTYQAEAPPQFRGGIIADPMGFGKTLTMIALAANDKDDINAPTTGVELMDIDGDDDRVQVGTTLIIIPPPCMSHQTQPCQELA
jgi:hypothetical protein